MFIERHEYFSSYYSDDVLEIRGRQVQNKNTDCDRRAIRYPYGKGYRWDLSDLGIHGTAWSCTSNRKDKSKNRMYLRISEKRAQHWVETGKL